MENDAANALLERAKNEQYCSTAYMLIDAAKRLNPELDTVSIKREWLNAFLEKQYQTIRKEK